MGSPVKTFIFLDLEATGLSPTNPKITELSMVAVHVSSIQGPVYNDLGELQLPRVLDKLSLCVDPVKNISDHASEITHLSRRILNKCEKQRFNTTLVNAIVEFMNRQAQPVCLVAHNGFLYDFALLKTEMRKVGCDFQSHLLCLDTLQSLRDLDNGRPNQVRVKGQYSLPELYRRYFHKEPDFSHYAEGDVLTLIRVFMYRADQLLREASYKTWGEIRPMYM